jgi:hypothetical protein
MTKIVSIDIGYLNMAIVCVETDFKDLFAVNNVYKINLSRFCETLVHRAVSKFIKEYSEIFENSDLILIEQQPPQGLTNIQDVLAYQYIDKVKLIHPRSVHKHFCLSKTDYDVRKKQTEKIADKYLSDNKIYKYSERKHDIADALCQILYYVTINKVVDVYIPDDIDNFLESCRYTNSSRTF